MSIHFIKHRKEYINLTYANGLMLAEILLIIIKNDMPRKKIQSMESRHVCSRVWEFMYDNVSGFNNGNCFHIFSRKNSSKIHELFLLKKCAGKIRFLLWTFCRTFYVEQIGFPEIYI